MNRQEQHEAHKERRRRIDGLPPAPIILLPPLKLKPKRFAWRPEHDVRLRVLWEAKVKVETIAAEFGCSTSILMRKRKSLGLDERHPVEPGRALTKNERDEFRVLWGKGKSIKYLARKFDIPVRSVSPRRKAMGLPARGRGTGPVRFEDRRNRNRVMIYLTKDEKANLYRRATSKGLALSHYIAKLLSAAIEKEDRGRYGRL